MLERIGVTAMEGYKTVYNCTGCKHYRNVRVRGEKFCNYALDEGKCRVINRKIVPAEKCFKDKIFFEGK